MLNESAGTELLLRYGVEYDHSFSHHDDRCYWLRTPEEIKPVEYDKHPREWMTPLKRGKETGIVEIPSNWYLDDLPPMVCPLPSMSSTHHSKTRKCLPK